MFLGLPGFAWFVIGVIVVAVLVTVANWYIMYCVFDWAVHHVKHVWLEEDLMKMNEEQIAACLIMAVVLAAFLIVKLTAA